MWLAQSHLGEIKFEFTLNFKYLGLFRETDHTEHSLQSQLNLTSKYKLNLNLI